MKRKILLVDDEEKILEAYRRILSSHYEITLAVSGAQALETMRMASGFEVIVVDLHMPEMDGIELLTVMKSAYPDVVRIALTGLTDQQTAVDAFAQGEVFRFLSKPCTGEALTAAIEAALGQHSGASAERQLLQQTRDELVQTLSQLLALANPKAFAQVDAMLQLMIRLAHRLEHETDWAFEPMVLLSQLGYVAIPAALVEKQLRGECLDADELALLADNGRLSHDLLVNIPGLATIAKEIQAQDRALNDAEANEAGGTIPYRARMLKICKDFLHFQRICVDVPQAVEQMRAQAADYDVEILASFLPLVSAAPGRRVPSYRVVERDLSQLSLNTVLYENIYTHRGQLVVAKGNRVTPPILRILRNCFENGLIKQRKIGCLAMSGNEVGFVSGKPVVMVE
ncbi:response regulator [Ferrimonas pelagia]|uniref:Response regulator n=1 Tax=Ferrimonas pelagia TaxID=1177826 RepID=A0ABP9FMW8_9GAMM